jgi:hypothetical protein
MCVQFYVFMVIKGRDYFVCLPLLLFLLVCLGSPESYAFQTLCATCENTDSFLEMYMIIHACILQLKESRFSTLSIVQCFLKT